MNITVTCGACGKSYLAPEKHAGKRIRCKNCGAVVSIPAPAYEPPREIVSPPGYPPIFPPKAKPAPAAEDNPFDNLDALMSLEENAQEVEPPPVVKRGRAAPSPPPPPQSGEPEDRLLAAPTYKPNKIKIRGQKKGAPAPEPAYVPHFDAYVSMPGASTIDRLIPLFIAVFFIWTLVNIIRLSSVVSERGGSVGALWGRSALGLAVQFAVIAPLGVLGVFIAARIMKFEMPQSPYLRFCGVLGFIGTLGLVVAATGMPAATWFSLLVGQSTLENISLAILIGLLFWTVILWLVLRLKPAPFAVSAAFVLICQIGGGIAFSMMLGMLLASSGAQNSKVLRALRDAPTPQTPAGAVTDERASKTMQNLFAISEALRDGYMDQLKMPDSLERLVEMKLLKADEIRSAYDGTVYGYQWYKGQKYPHVIDRGWVVVYDLAGRTPSGAVPGLLGDGTWALITNFDEFQRQSKELRQAPK